VTLVVVLGIGVVGGGGAIARFLLDGALGVGVSFRSVRLRST
jgi:hypothetical protein